MIDMLTFHLITSLISHTVGQILISEAKRDTRSFLHGKETTDSTETRGFNELPGF